MRRLPARRDGDAVVVGHGPELLVRIERGAPGPAVEVAVAVKELPRKGKPDALGGDSIAREAAGVRLVVRAFRRPPEKTPRR